MLISAVLVPLILLAAVLAPGWYGRWKAWSHANGLPLPDPPRPARDWLARTVAEPLREKAVSAYGTIRTAYDAWNDRPSPRWRR